MNTRVREKRPFTKIKPSDVVFTGLARTPDLLKKSINDLIALRKEGLVNQIIFSTWKGEIKKDSETFSLLKKNKVILIESDEPNPRGKGNVWCQMKALDVALRKVDVDRFVLKTRADTYINPKFLKKILTSPKLFELGDNLPKGNIFKNKVWTVWFELTRPFFMSDEAFYGRCEDLKKLYNYETKYDTDFVVGAGLTHVRRFIDPFVKDYPIFYDSLERYNDNKSWIVKLKWFMWNVYDLRKITLLRKIYETRRFKILGKRLKDKDYLNMLAAYYSILDSHFYIDGDSFPNQVIFRESTTPTVKLDENNWENNFSREKQRFKYGGQIYAYNGNLIRNIFNKNIEDTPSSRKLLKAINEFNKSN